MSEVSTDKKLKGKDLITIGIFSAIYFVINFAFMLLGGIHPVLWMLMPGFIAVFAGIPFMLMVAKVQKLGAVFLMGLITALIYFVTGQFTLVIPTIFCRSLKVQLCSSMVHLLLNICNQLLQFLRRQLKISSL